MSTPDAGRDKQIPLSLSPLTRLRAARNDKVQEWAAGWATFGAVVWAGIAVLARLGVARIGMIELVFLFAPLVIVPLGMELGRVSGASSSQVGRRFGGWAQVLQPLGAAMAVFAMLLPPGKWAGVLALGWLVVCGVAGAGGAVELVRTVRDARCDCEELVDSARREGVVRSLPFASLGIGMTSTALGDLAAAVAKIDLAVGGAWLVASRLGMRPMGIQEPIGLLTAVHFHFAGFATAMIASSRASLDRTAEGGCPHMSSKWLRRVVLLAVGMPFLVAVGFVASPALKMVAGAMFAASVAGLAMFVWNCEVEDRRARGFLRAAVGAVFAGAVLAGVYAVADFVGSDVLT